MVGWKRMVVQLEGIPLKFVTVSVSLILFFILVRLNNRGIVLLLILTISFSLNFCLCPSHSALIALTVIGIVHCGWLGPSPVAWLGRSWCFLWRPIILLSCLVSSLRKQCFFEGSLQIKNPSSFPLPHLGVGDSSLVDHRQLRQLLLNVLGRWLLFIKIGGGTSVNLWVGRSFFLKVHFVILLEFLARVMRNGARGVNYLRLLGLLFIFDDSLHNWLLDKVLGRVFDAHVFDLIFDRCLLEQVFLYFFLTFWLAALSRNTFRVLWLWSLGRGCIPISHIKILLFLEIFVCLQELPLLDLSLVLLELSHVVREPFLGRTSLYRWSSLSGLLSLIVWSLVRSECNLLHTNGFELRNLGWSWVSFWDLRVALVSSWWLKCFFKSGVDRRDLTAAKVELSNRSEGG